MYSNTTALVVTGGILAALAAGAFAYGPVAVPPEYFDFADKRALGSLPKAGDVLSNLPFVLAGGYGVWHIYRRDLAPGVSWSMTAFFLFVAFVGPGSAYFHWNPGPETVTPDRLPIALAGAALLVGVLADRLQLSLRTSLASLGGAVALAGAVTMHAHVTGDIRLYAFAQLAPIVTVLAFITLGRKGAHSLSNAQLFLMVAFYACAKAFEFLDYAVLKTICAMSGHTIKHFLAAAAALSALPYRRTEA